MIEKRILYKIIDILISRGADFVDIFIEKTNNLNINIENKKLEKILFGKTFGVGIRACYGFKTFFGFTEDFSENNLIELSRNIAYKKKLKILNKNLIFNLKKANNLDINKNQIDNELKDKIDFILSLNKYLYKKKSMIIESTINYNETKQEICVMNSRGVYINDFRPRVRLLSECIVGKSNMIQRYYDVVGGLNYFSWIKDKIIPNSIENIPEKAISLLLSKKAPSGEMDIVLSGEAGGTMVHEACGHGLEGDIIKKKASVYNGKINKKIASSLVTVIDDGTIKNAYGSSFYDDEGTKTQKNILIDKGYLSSYIYDLKTAEYFKKSPTGNGRRDGYYNLPIVRMTNTYILPGKDKKEDIISSVKNGLFVKKMGGGQVDTITGDFVFDVVDGYLISNGKIKDQVKGATLIGNGPEVLNKIDMVGDDIGYSIGVCGKYGQGIHVSDAQPTMRIPRIIVGGTEK